jgi:hypothetical protein
MQTHHGKFSHLFIALAARFQEHSQMRTHCQFTVKRPEKRGDLTVAPEQQPCGVQVVEWVGLVASGFQFLLGLAAVLAEEVNRPL